MYRLFAMDDLGRLYQLSSAGWAATGGTTFPTKADARAVPDGMGVPPLPNGGFIRDAYIARVDAAGMVVKTFPFSTFAAVAQAEDGRNDGNA